MSTTLITPLYAAMVLRAGKVIAYPTEGVYGLGCDPFNASAVNNLLQLKQRSINKGLILLASTWQQGEFLVAKEKIPTTRLKEILSTWSERAVTWVFPAATIVPPWIRGEHATIALRITSHPTARAICQEFGCPIVSTSANIATLPSTRSRRELLKQFGNSDLKFVVQGKIGRLRQPTPIYDALTGKIWRK